MDSEGSFVEANPRDSQTFTEKKRKPAAHILLLLVNQEFNVAETLQHVGDRLALDTR